MLDGPQQSQTVASSRSDRKWIALAAGGGCALIACAGLVVVLAFTYLNPIFRSTTNPGNTVVQETAVQLQAVPVTPSAAPALLRKGNTMGDPNAPVKVVEYADFQCPYCQRYWQETEPQLIDSYIKTGKVYYEYRSLGAFLGPESADAAQAAYCAGDQEKFWEYHDVLFSNWSGENVGDFTKEKLVKYAASIGLDQAAFAACLNTGKYANRLQQDVNNAGADGVHATPSFVINGKLLEGAQPFDAFQKAIDAALQGN